MRAPRVNETKVTSRNTFIDNLFPLKSEKEAKMDEATLFETACVFLTCLLPLDPESTSMWFSGLL